ncbi:MAG TPA: dihydroorotate dehydrogenase (quinone) [Cryomorphaceae bacterium]|nr:dihydroorotate dehydrogenase (quinone) [Owenweeksia sp.]HBF19837.1 dihydroorotate dehydrogenase (quinone) [Cryomorphaceae bacterium]HCQ15735.1 dihydroorotate dehydrogenase (quinone) [Cryomorphaceae bacterium]|tara:strand:- start:1384 stop:2415 length:1032 start_codon:yes stop_codon:yes gene_type:complete
MYKSLIRPFLFRFDPEKIHHFTFRCIAAIHKLPGMSALLRGSFTVKDERLKRKVFGLEFENPVGLAAGFDKDGKLFEELASFGFGFIEVGTVTPKPQAGNPKPRLFRLPSDKALINRMGFNNEGVDALVERLRHRENHNLIIGGNIGKNKTTPNEQAIEDYLYCFDRLFDYVDYFVVNVSSPNTPNLRDLQDKKPLTDLLKSLQEENSQKHTSKPILLKIAPDLTDAQLDDIIDIVRITRIHGIIATNTTINRAGLKTPTSIVESAGMGGLSGKPLKARSTEVIRYLHTKSGGKFPIIAVGGIYTAEDAREKLDAGASLVQVYTGFIYEGPAMVKKINRGLLK